MPADEAAPPEVISAVNEPVDEAAALVEAQAIIEQVLSQTHAEVEVEVESPSTATSEANLSAVDGVDHQDGEDQVLSQQEVKDLGTGLAGRRIEAHLAILNYAMCITSAIKWLEQARGQGW